MTTKFTTSIQPPEPPPRTGDGQVDPEYISRLYRWLYEVYRRLEQAGLLDWDAIDLADGKLGDLNDDIGITDFLSYWFAVQVVSADYTAGSYRNVKVTGACTITLPAASSYSGYDFLIDNAHTSSITVNPSGTDTIEDETSQSIPSNSAMRVYSDGTSNWRIG